MSLTNGTNLTTLSNILKEYYLGPVAEQLNNEILLLARLNTRSEDLVGKRAYVPLHVSRSGGIGARAEAAPLPSAGNQDYDKAVYDLKYLYGRVQVTGPSMAKTKNEAGAFLQALKSELDGIRNDLQKDLARQVYAKGEGIIADCGTTSSSTTVQLDTATGKEAIRKGQLYVGMLVDIGTTADVDSQSGATAREITAVDYDNATITVSGAAFSTTSSHRVFRAGSGVDNGVLQTGSRSNEVDGLRRIVSVGQEAFGEIDPATKTWWDNKRVNAQTENTGTLTLDMIQKALNLVRLEGGMPTVMVTTLGVQREFYGLLSQEVQYVDPASLNYAAGFRTLSYGGMPIISDIDAPYGNMYILDESTLKVFSDQDWHFLDADGQTLRQVSGYDAFEAIMTRYMNLGATKRSNHCVIHGIEVDGNPDAGI
jgi:hypothetical protein